MNADSHKYARDSEMTQKVTEIIAKYVNRDDIAPKTKCQLTAWWNSYRLSICNEIAEMVAMGNNELFQDKKIMDAYELFKVISAPKPYDDRSMAAKRLEAAGMMCAAALGMQIVINGGQQ